MVKGRNTERDSPRRISPKEFEDYCSVSFREEFQKAYGVEKLRIQIAGKFIGGRSSRDLYVPEGVIDAYIDKRSTLEVASPVRGTKASSLKTAYQEIGIIAAYLTTPILSRRKLKKLNKIVKDRIFERRSKE